MFTLVIFGYGMEYDGDERRGEVEEVNRWAEAGRKRGRRACDGSGEMDGPLVMIYSHKGESAPTILQMAIVVGKRKAYRR